MFNKIKKLFICFLLLSASLLTVQAQTDFARTFATACGQAGNVSFTVGQPSNQPIKNFLSIKAEEISKIRDLSATEILRYFFVVTHNMYRFSLEDF